MSYTPDLNPQPVGGDTANAATDGGNPVKIGAVYRVTPTTLTSGQRGDLAIDAQHNLLVNQRNLAAASDSVTAQNTSAGQLFATTWLYDGAGNPIASFSPTGGTNLLKVATADTRNIYQQGTGNTINANGTSGDISTYNARYWAIDINVGTPTGASPTLAFFLDRKGAEGIYYQVAALTPTYTTSPGANSWHIGPGMPVNILLGSTMRLRWVVGGTTPSYPTASINLYQQT